MTSEAEVRRTEQQASIKLIAVAALLFATTTLFNTAMLVEVVTGEYISDHLDFVGIYLLTFLNPLFLIKFDNRLKKIMWDEINRIVMWLV